MSVDRCAFRREEQKPTNILTNGEDWTPKGRTRNGRCKAGCALGDDETPNTVPSSKKAVKNTLEPELVKDVWGDSDGQGTTTRDRGKGRRRSTSGTRGRRVKKRRHRKRGRRERRHRGNAPQWQLPDKRRLSAQWQGHLTPNVVSVGQ